MIPSLTHTIWLEGCNSAFVYLPKVACTSWKLFLAEGLHGALPADLAYRDVHNPVQLPLPVVGQMPTGQQRAFVQQLTAGEIQLLAMWRDPRRRILSAYLDKIVRPPNPTSVFAQTIRPAIQAHHHLPADSTPSFLQFLQWLGDATHAGCSNDHWKPMSQLLGLEHDAPGVYQHIWRLEEIPAAAAEINRRLGRSIAFPGFEALGPRRSSGSDELLVHSFAAEGVEPLFAELYARDLEIDGSIG
jgi:hypothetical protein